MGGLCESDSDTQTLTTTSQTSIPEWMNAGGRDIFNSAKALSKRAYQPYTGPRVAGLSGNENRAISSAASNAGAWKPTTNAAKGMMTQGGQQWGGDQLSRYMNP